MEDDIASNIEFKPLLIGLIVSVILVVIGTAIGNSFLLIFGPLIGSAITGFITINSSKYALIYGAVIGIVSSFFMLFSVFSMPIYIILGIFGGFIGKAIQSKV